MTGFPRPVNGDCLAGLHRLCFGEAWSYENDHLAPCECDCHTERNAA
ncbi:hypothetical protein [Rathayibacter sp. Leaf299]|nr:hypothetical protein [Rathayibacter sp. Leaf299]